MNMQTEAPALHLRTWIFLVLLVTSVLGIGNRGLLVPDEAREAAILLEMARDRDFVVPHLAGQPFVEKPPLYYFVGTLIYDVAHPTLSIEAIGGVTSALFGLGTLAACWVLARRWLGTQRAWLTVALLAISDEFVDNAHYIRSDISLLCMVACAVACFSEAYLAERRGALILGALFTGLALLAKGLVGPAVIFPAWLAFVVMRYRYGSRPTLGRELLWHSLALCVFALVTAPWMLALYQRDPALWQAWFHDNQFGRVAGTAGLGHDREGMKPWFYLFALCGSTVPWSPLFFAWIWFAFRNWKRGEGRRVDALLGAWIGGVVLLLTLSSTKRNLYLMPLMPALAMAGAACFPAAPQRWLEKLLRWTPYLALLCIAAVAVSPWLFEMGASIQSRWERFVPAVGSTEHYAALILIVLALVLVVCHRLTRPLEAALCALCFFHWLLLCVTIPSLAKYIDPRGEIAALDHVLLTQPRTAFAAFGVSEMQRGWLYLYSSRDLDEIDLERANEILLGRDPQFGGLVVGKQQSLELLHVPARTIFDAHLDPEEKSRARLSVLLPQ